MFGRKRMEQQIEDLTAGLRALRERLEVVELRTEPFRVGEDNRIYALAYMPDTRPAITHEKAIKLLMDHCGVQFKKVPECVVLEKKKA